MDLLEVVLAVVIAGVCGAVAEWIVGYSPGQLIAVTLVGVVGAYLGHMFAVALARIGVPPLVLVQVGTITINIVWATLASCLLLLVLSIMRGGRRRTIFARTAEE